jgi:hypothetical protein
MSDKLKVEQMLSLLSVVDETCTPLALQLLDPQNPISSEQREAIAHIVSWRL